MKETEQKKIAAHLESIRFQIKQLSELLDQAENKLGEDPLSSQDYYEARRLVGLAVAQISPF